MLEHPLITQINQLGYPAELLEEEIEHAGLDYYGDEIIEGDPIAEYNGETILQSNLQRYLNEEFGFIFKTAE
ncbi:YqaI family protein [Niallia circulans]|uniref:YqaI family protein n=1 Tax=Niallia circulans TaxID=1397 RepID=UPI003009F5DD